MPQAPGRLHWRPTWERLRKRVLDSQNWRCGCGCGRLAQEVHHRDHDRSNNSVDNLVALATRCHVLIHDRLKDRPKARAWREFVRELRR